MIYEFGFENFRSYKRAALLDFTAKPINEFRTSVISADQTTGLLPVCAVYGPNGGGKSSVLYALMMMRNIAVGPLVEMTFMKAKNEKLAGTSIEELKGSLKSLNIEDFCYKWDEQSKNNPTEFSVLFQTNHRKYRYELAVIQGIIQKENLFAENLKTREIFSVFERDTESAYLHPDIENIDISQINEGLSLISYISMFRNVSLIDDVLQFFLTIQVIDFDLPTQDRQIMVKMIENNKKMFLKVLGCMGIDICDVTISYDESGHAKNIFTKHHLQDGSFKELQFEEESSGTRKIFSILPIILHAVEKGSLLVIDELDAKLHPMLLQQIIELFTNPEINRKGAQLLFTSHDMTTMSGKVFRRDEIWFSAMNSSDESILYSLVDFRKKNGEKPRNDETYNKQYLEGRYGADPYFHRIQRWEDVL